MPHTDTAAGDSASLPTRIGIGVVAIAGAATAALAAYWLRERMTESADYTVLEGDGAFEIRAYPTLVTVTAEQMGSRSGALDSGYRALSDYITGRSGGRRAGASRQAIAMTQPVLLEPGEIGQTWTVRFVMPQAWCVDELPEPRAGLAIDRQNPCTVAVLRFAGNAISDPALVARHTEALQRQVADRGRAARGPVLQAFYNAPFVPPFMRRNEVWLELVD